MSTDLEVLPLRSRTPGRHAAPPRSPDSTDDDKTSITGLHLRRTAASQIRRLRGTSRQTDSDHGLDLLGYPPPDLSEEAAWQNRMLDILSGRIVISDSPGIGAAALQHQASRS
jgi:hypothetical protein